LNPAERVTARFKCKQCSMVERKYSQDGMFLIGFRVIFS
jgi:hypothetical protein